MILFIPFIFTALGAVIVFALIAVTVAVVVFYTRLKKRHKTAAQENV